MHALEFGRPCVMGEVVHYTSACRKVPRFQLPNMHASQDKVRIPTTRHTACQYHAQPSAYCPLQLRLPAMDVREWRDLAYGAPVRPASGGSRTPAWDLHSVIRIAANMSPQFAPPRGDARCLCLAWLSKRPSQPVTRQEYQVGQLNWPRAIIRLQSSRPGQDPARWPAP